jgi:hypothetical protein
MKDNLPAHAKLSPSGASKWMTCPGSIEAEEGLPDDTSEFAAEGTCAHEVSDLCLSLGLDAYDFIGARWEVDGFTITFDGDMAEALQVGIDWCREQPGEFFGEHRVDLTHWLGPDQFGTLDRGWVAPDRIVINDLKFGRGVPVSPVENKQLRIYALGFWKAKASHITDPDFPVHIVIDQPRCPGGGGEWITTLGALWEFGEEIREAAIRALTPGAPRTASQDGCLWGWCKRWKAPSGCDTFNEFNLEILGLKFEDLDEEEITLERALTPERRGRLLLHRKMIEKWLDQQYMDCMKDASRGDSTGPVKAVLGPKTRAKFTDKAAVHEILAPLVGEKRFEDRLVSPGRLKTFNLSPEAMEMLEKLIQPGAPTTILVPEGDARPAIEPVEAKFDEEED